MKIPNKNLLKSISLARLLRTLEVGDSIIIPEEVSNQYKVRGELARFKRLYGLEFTSTIIGIENGIKVTRLK